ncbi:TPA: NAD(P)-dependent oxidoreductase [Candidatus Poribacteria bacterium]|nr:NAD(P)-dependent oxidoreductase [Candidatus Poribacteria bacterium]
MILVTGAARRLMDKGYHVLSMDRVAFEDSPSPFVQAELCDTEWAKALLTDAEVVIYMGVIPGPGADRYETFENNTIEYVQYHVGSDESEFALCRVLFQRVWNGLGA